MEPSVTARPEAAELRRVLMPFSPPGAESGFGGPVVFQSGQGVWLTDRAGERYLDGVGALEAMAIGHGRHELADVASRQMRELAFLDVFRHVSQPALDLAEQLVEISPDGLNHVHFTPGGSEAVEVALKLVFQYHALRGEPDRTRVISRRGAYHGVTFGAMQCDGDYYATRNDLYLRGPSFGAVAGDGVDRGDWGPGARHTAGAAQFEAKLLELGPENVAAIIVDGVATASAVAAPGAADLRAIRELCDAHGVLLIVDEVITGFCRTGAFFVSELYGVLPDVMPMSKALSSGYMPIGATLVGDRITDEFARSSADGVFAHGHTYGGHPVACAVASENIRILQREELAARAATQGDYLRDGLRTLSDHPAWVDARGVGMLNGLEVVAGDEEAGSFGTAAAAAGWMRRRCLELGLITLTVHPGTVLLLAPPLVIDHDEIDQMVSILDTALTDMEARR